MKYASVYKKVVNFSIGLLLVSPTAHASDESIQANMQKLFTISEEPMRVSRQFDLAQANLDAKKKAYFAKNFKDAVSYDDEYDESYFCFNEGLATKLGDAGGPFLGVLLMVPFSDLEFSKTGGYRLKISEGKNGQHQRCEKYRLSFYRKNPKFLTHFKTNWGFPDSSEQYLYSDLPSRFREYADIALGNLQNPRLKATSEAFARVKAQASAMAQDSSLSPVEVCAAVAIADVATASTDVEGYKTRIAFLGYTINGWLAKTGGNASICPNFGLELRVQELSERVDSYERSLRALADRQSSFANQLNAEIRQREARTVFSTAAFWGLAFAGYRVLNPF